MSSFVPWTRFPDSAPPAPWWVRRRERLLVPPERVWSALTEVAELVQWWCDEAVVEPREGGIYAFGGPHVLGGSTGLPPPASRRAILEAVPPERLVFQWPLLGIDTTVTYELENCMEMTEITVTQAAGRAVGWDLGEEIQSWWTPAFASLRSYLEKGRPDLRLDFPRIEAQEDIRLEVGITTFPWVIWDKLTQVRELRKWWSREAELEASPGGPFRLGDRRHGPRRCLAAEAETLFIHDWTWNAAEATPIEWRLEESDKDVRVSVTDRGPWPPELPRAAVAIHWASVLLSLQQMSERGTSQLEA